MADFTIKNRDKQIKKAAIDLAAFLKLNVSL